MIAYAYDVQGRVAEKDEYPTVAAFGQGVGSATKVVTYAYDGYDASGRTFSSVTNDDRSSAALKDNGTTTSYSNAEGQLVEVDSPQGDVHYEYDPTTGQKSRVFTGNPAAPTTDIDYAYDGNGRLLTVTAVALDGAAVNLRTTYAYDLADELVATTLPNGTAEYRTYDALGRLASVETANIASGLILAGFTYATDLAGQRTSVVADAGRSIAPSFDAKGRVNLNLGTAPPQPRTEAYTYDLDGRLTADLITNDPLFPNGTRAYTYAYDLAGNRIRMTDSGSGTGSSDLASTYDADGRLREVNGTSAGTSYDQTYTYDPNGSTLTVTLAGHTTTDTWDIEGHLVETDVPGASGTIHHTSYAYDDDGDRVAEATDGQLTRYLNDKNQAYDQVLEEYAPGGVLAATYVRGLDLLFQDRAGVRSYYAVDGLGSTRALTNSAGAITDTENFDAFRQCD